MSLSTVIMGKMQQKIEEGKIVKNDNFNYNKKHGEPKKEYMHPVRTI